MSNVSRKNKKEKRIRLPAEYTEGALLFKAGAGWKACYDSERKLYTAETCLAGYYDLYEINEEIFGKLKWADVQKTGETREPELTDPAAAVFDSEKQNLGQRLKKCDEHEKNENN